MTDVSPSDDELVSSYLDHEATPEEVARVETDPRLIARAEEMRAAITFVTTPPPVPEADLDRIRATAVAAFTPVAAPVVDLAAARAKRLERRNRLLAVAAAVLLFGGIVAGIASIDGGDSDDTAGDASTDAGADDAADDSGDDADFGALGSANEGDADMAEAEMAVDNDMADEALAETAPTGDDSDDAADGDSSADTDDTESTSAQRLQQTPAFDPLPDDLGGFASAADLAVEVESLVTGLIGDEESDFAPEDFLPLTTCEETLAVALADDTNLDVDTASAVVDATLYSVVVGRQPDSGAFVGRIAPSEICSPATELFVAP